MTCRASQLSFPLDGARGLRRDVVGHPVDARHLVDDALRHHLEHVVGNPGPVGGHRIVAGDRTDDDGVAVGAFVAHHTDRTDVGEHGERLPDLAFETGEAQFLADDCVSLLQQRHSFRGDLADDPHAEAGPGERLTPHHLVGQAEFEAELADLVLEELAQRLDELEAPCPRASHRRCGGS